MSQVIIIDLFSAQPKGNIKFHGGGEYIKTIFKQLTDQVNEGIVFFTCYDTSIYIDDWIISTIDEKKINVVNVTSEAEIVDFVNSTSESNEVRFFTGMIYNYKKSMMPISKKVYAIGTCHGLRTLEKPIDKYMTLYSSDIQSLAKDFAKKTIFKNSLHKRYKNGYLDALSNFDAIITVSNHSNYAIRVFLNEIIDNANIYTYYTPMKIETRCTASSDSKYIMLISADRWLKNSYRAVMAIDNLYGKNYLGDTATYIFGNLPDKIFKRIKHKEKFKLFGYVDSVTLEKSYANCSLFVYPTLNEGFGLPPLEAMKYGKTCAISNVCSLPEVYGDSVYYFDPYDLSEIENRILQGIEHKIPEDKIFLRIKEIENKQAVDLHNLCALISDFETKENT